MSDVFKAAVDNLHLHPSHSQFKLDRDFDMGYHDNLLKAAVEYQIRAEQERMTAILFDQINWAMRPFRLTLTAQVSEEFNYQAKKFIITTPTFPDDPFVYRFSYTEVRRGYDPESFLWHIGGMAARYFRGLYTQPEDHIILGED